LTLTPLPLPRVRALSLLTDEGSSVRDVADLVEGDPGLTAAVLRAANSVISAPRSRVRTAGQAIVRIGLGATRRIVTGAVAGNAFDNLQRSGVDVDALWRHLIGTALIAGTVARVGDGATDAFTSGLLHDLGRMAMASRDPNRYARIASLARRGVPVSEAEYLMYGANHAQVGADLAEAWRLPEEVVEAIGSHHDADPKPGLCAAVARARQVAVRLGLGDGVVPPPPPDAATAEDDAAIVRELRGARALMSRIEWYREAIQQI
jgi:putative nucleotidyltransferase with HDIG domain